MVSGSEVRFMCNITTFSRCRKKVIKKTLLFFFMSFSSVVGAILDIDGIHCPLGCCTGHLFGRGASLQVMLVSFR
jgi:hypothetical protein